ncbi:mitochondrial ribonuclease P protein 1 homolog [Ylistrum balloti]|uniref:mitochondrial ribonuclease P protein 1 homolog n=1 Tax=Ylistrum balloti TaxID=509963 RepID=UPI002905A2E4|nr:mitochondrial ribonuclease P protein 1 homolog [Ylistrum balloti]XP_060080968.1 mitochondrial ribonuclease P protein 1 homolog [Ylistrum balloti]
MRVIVGLRSFIRPVLETWKCVSSVNTTIPRRCMDSTPVRFSSYRNFCDQKSQDEVEVVTSEKQEQNCRTNEEGGEKSRKEITLPKSLPLPSKEFLDSLNDAQMKHYLNITKRYEFLLQKNAEYLKLPTTFTDSSWRKLLEHGVSRTSDVLELLYFKELKKKRKKEKIKEVKAEKKDIVHQYSKPQQISMKAFTILNAYQAMEYGPKLIYDFGFTSNTEVSHIFKEESRIRRQIIETIHGNSKKRFPFHLVFCNVNKKNRSMLEEEAAGVPITITERNYLDLFEQQELVYLSPDSWHDLETFNHEEVYIVGCITDLVTKPFTKKKAQKQGIKLRKFPIREHLGNTTSCLLTLNQVCNVLHDLKDTGDWRTALRHVPLRFQK